MPGKSRYWHFSPQAVSDLEEIWRYTCQNWSPEQADSYHRNLVAAFEGLADGRKSARPVDIREGYMKYGVGAHVIYFRTTIAGIDIIRVLHGRMDANKHF